MDVTTRPKGWTYDSPLSQLFHPYLNISEADAEQKAGMQYAFIAEFESASDRDYYIKSDPAHHAFIGKAMPILEKPIVVDFAEDVY